VCDELDRELRKFLWGGTTMERKSHLMAWETVTKEKENGVLRLRSIRQLNSAYFTKLGRRLANKPKSLWAKVLKMKYCKGKDIETMRVRGQALNTWRGIMESIHLSKKGVDHTIGDGHRTKFWTHKWVDRKEIISKVTCDVPEDQRQLQVRDYWKEDTGWD